jgi:hypothetical protein
MKERKKYGLKAARKRAAVQQAIIYSLKMLKKPGNTLFSGAFSMSKILSGLFGFDGI